MSGFPTLAAYVGANEVVRVAAPSPISPRDWALGVVAVQVVVTELELVATLRAHVTGGGDAHTVTLPVGTPAHVALVPAGASPPPLPRTPLTTFAAAACLDLLLDGQPVGRALLEPAAFGHRPPPRAFGHVFCRFFRNGNHEAGFDLTDFLSLPEGVKYERRVRRTLSARQVVTFVLRVR